MATSRVVLFAAMLLASTDVWGLRIMSFNVQKFGTTKFSNVEVVDWLVQVSYTATRDTLLPALQSFTRLCRYSASTTWVY